jgi:hypothetical protein
MGEEPVARQTFAAKFWTTRLVMLWQRGLVRTCLRVTEGTWETRVERSIGKGVVVRERE